MALSTPRFSISATIFPSISKNTSNILQPFINFSQFSRRNASFGCRYGLLCCYAAAKQQKSGGAPATKRKKKPSSKNNSKTLTGDDFVIEKSGTGGGGGGGRGVEVLESPSQSDQSPYTALPLPKPPAGFVLDEQGRVLMASNKRIATIVDSANNLPLECVIRRVFSNSRGDECMLLCPVDTPVQILKSVNVEGWSAVSDEEVDAILPTAAYALAKIHMHLVHSGFCYTARGGFCYTEEDIFEFHIDNGEDVEGLPTEGIEIACFHLDGSHYMIYTPSDPLLFVVVKDKNGVLQIADDELLDDPAIISAIDEETEFNALVEEEAALLDSLLGKR
ncbi:uncharacterized protein LOC105178033 [Sesamum indicum]|uniref:Uncharacterized protein LOC105178033 n=1 Tax=Sesamum indicum TaxID=4182 RepID=A0A8M8VF05_SESIN|nr:uncharacterized protein LOC105178033 [Sesamum indicum]